MKERDLFILSSSITFLGSMDHLHSLRWLIKHSCPTSSERFLPCLSEATGNEMDTLNRLVFRYFAFQCSYIMCIYLSPLKTSKTLRDSTTHAETSQESQGGDFSNNVCSVGCIHLTVWLGTLGGVETQTYWNEPPSSMRVMSAGWSWGRGGIWCVRSQHTPVCPFCHVHCGACW